MRLGLLLPRDSLTESERQQGLRGLTWQMVSSAGADGLVSGGFLTAFALLIGASNFHIGIMMAIPFIVQPIQLFVVVLIERLRVRKAIAVTSYLVVYASWVPIALIPFVMDIPNAGAVAVLLFFVALRGIASAFLNTSWNGWLRDIVPQEVIGKFFADRTKSATIAAAVVGMGAAVFIDLWRGRVAETDVIFGYSYAILFGSLILGLAAVAAMASIPEARMAALEGPRSSALKSLSAPLKDKNYRQLVFFLFLWHVAAHLAVPFFAVYMLVKLELSLTLVVGLGVGSQVAMVLFLRVWGLIIDQYGSRAVLYAGSSLYFLVILGWIFTTMPNKHDLTLPLLVVLHLLIGIAGAGVSVSMTTMRLQMTPRAQSTAYMTASSLAINLGAGISPLLGGAFADFFAQRQFKISVEWIDPTRTIDFPALFLTGYDFLFVVAFFVGLFTLSVLSGIREAGERDPGLVMDELMVRTRDSLRAVGAVPGLGLISHFPLTTIRRLPDIPGLDVAVGVTAYQIASSLQSAVSAALKGIATVSDLNERISRTVSDALSHVEEAGELGVEATRELAAEIVRSADVVGIRGAGVARNVVGGLLHAISTLDMDARKAVSAVVHGAVLGSREVGAELPDAVAQAVEGAQQAAGRLGLSEHEARVESVKGALDAASSLAPEEAGEVQKALLEALLIDTPRDTEA